MKFSSSKYTTTDIILGSLNTSFCIAKKDLTDPTSQQFLQSACINNQTKTFNEAQILCRDNGMELINVNADATKAALISFVKELNEQSNFYVEKTSSGDCQILQYSNEDFTVVSRSCDAALPSICGYVAPGLSSNFSV